MYRVFFYIDKSLFDRVIHYLTSDMYKTTSMTILNRCDIRM